MGVRLHHALSTNLVLVGIDLLTQQEETEQFAKLADLELKIDRSRTINVSSGQTEQSRKFTSELDRIVLETSASRATIARQYPVRADLARFSQVIGAAIACTDLQNAAPRAFGYNIEMTFDQDSRTSALAYLGTHLFGDLSLGNPDWNFVGATARAVFADRSGQWTISAEPRFGDSAQERVFLNLNLHKAEQRVPDEHEIEESLNLIWDECSAFMDRLDARRLP